MIQSILILEDNTFVCTQRYRANNDTGENDVPYFECISTDAFTGTTFRSELTPEQWEAVNIVAIGGDSSFVSEECKRVAYEATKEWPVNVRPIP